MARDHVRLANRKLAFDDVQIGAADSARADANQNFTLPRLRYGDLGPGQRRRFNGSGRSQDPRMHQFTLTVTFVGMHI